MIRTLLSAFLTAAAISLSTLAVRAEEPAAGDQTTTTAPATPPTCTACLKGEYVAMIKLADFLDGDKISGTFLGFDNDFAKFRVKGSKEEIFIPKSAILYIKGVPPHFDIRY